MANTPLAGYPQPIGSKYRNIFDHSGPKSYLNIGTSSHAGDIILASDLGLGGFETIIPAFGAWLEGYTQSGNYIVKMFTASSATTPSTSIGAGLAFTKVVLQWFTVSAAFGAISTEVTDTTDLSAELIRFDATMV